MSFCVFYRLISDLDLKYSQCVLSTSHCVTEHCVVRAWIAFGLFIEPKFCKQSHDQRVLLVFSWVVASFHSQKSCLLRWIGDSELPINMYMYECCNGLETRPGWAGYWMDELWQCPLPLFKEDVKPFCHWFNLCLQHKNLTNFRKMWNH